MTQCQRQSKEANKFNVNENGSYHTVFPQVQAIPCIIQLLRLWESFKSEHSPRSDSFFTPRSDYCSADFTIRLDMSPMQGLHVAGLSHTTLYTGNSRSQPKHKTPCNPKYNFSTQYWEGREVGHWIGRGVNTTTARSYVPLQGRGEKDERMACSQVSTSHRSSSQPVTERNTVHTVHQHARDNCSRVSSNTDCLQNRPPPINQPTNQQATVYR